MSIGSSTYDSSQTVQSEVTLEHELAIAQTGSQTFLDGYWNLDATAQPEKRRITIVDVPSESAFYLVKIESTTPKTYALYWDAAEPIDEPAIAAELAALCNLSPDVASVVVGPGADANKIDLTSVLPGTNGAFTLDVSCVSIDGGGSIAAMISEAQQTAASGTGKMRKLLRAEVGLVITPQGYPGVHIKKVEFYNGAASPAVVGGNTLPVLPHNIRMDSLRVVA